MFYVVQYADIHSHFSVLGQKHYFVQVSTQIAHVHFQDVCESVLHLENISCNNRNKIIK